MFLRSKMKASPYVVLLAVFWVGVGCRTSHDHRAANDLPQPVPEVSLQPAYTVKVFPNARLTPTSREGDSAPVYSSNIVGVFVKGAGTHSEDLEAKGNQ